MKISFSILKTNGEIHDVEYKVRKKNGTYAFISIDGTCKYDDRENFTRTHCIFRDITDEKRADSQLEKERKKAESYLDLAGVIIIALNSKGEITLINKKGYEVLEYQEGELIGKNWFLTCLPPSIKDEIFDVFKQLMKGEIEAVEFYENSVYTKNNTVKLIAWHNTLLRDDTGTITGTLSSGEDITERIKTEKKIKESEEKYRTAYNRSNLYKDIFTHDINNILQNILTSLELSKMYSNESYVRKEYKEVTNLISEQITRGKNLVKNVQDLALIDDIKKNLSSIEVISVLRKSCDYLKDSYRDKTINIEIISSQNEYYVKANEVLKDIFENLLFNAVNHNKTSTILISIKISKETREGSFFIKFEFKDNGIGIPYSMKDNIFSREYKEGEISTGIGLGLLLVKRILEMYDGEISVEDRIIGDHSQGSKFIILIPESQPNN